MRVRGLFTMSAAWCIACAANEGAFPDAGPFDGIDGGSSDGGSDGGARDATLDSARPDASTATPVVDGVLGASEWEGAELAENDVPTTWGANLNELSRLRARVAGGVLYVAIEGRLEGGAENAIVLFADARVGTGSGVEPITLADGTGALDDSISCGLTAVPAFRADHAWGTKDFGRSASGSDDRMGWRHVADSPGDFGWVDASLAPTVCATLPASGPALCETSIALSDLGSGAGDTIALVARITNAAGTDFSNQALPEDMPETPASIATYLEVAVP
jgi:hypothetical protein